MIFGRAEEDVISVNMCCQIDEKYLRSGDSLLKIAELFLGIITAICADSGDHAASKYLLVVAGIGLLLTLTCYFINVLSVKKDVRYPYCWHLAELIGSSIITCMYLSVSTAQIVMSATTHLGPTNLAAGCLALLITLVYGGESILHYKRVVDDLKPSRDVFSQPKLKEESTSLSDIEK